MAGHPQYTVKNHYTKVYGLGEERRKTKQKMLTKILYCWIKLFGQKNFNDKKNNLM